MNKSVLLIMLDDRNTTAVNVQKVLSGWGCLIKTRLGLHDNVLDNCTDSGLIILEMVGEEEKHHELERKLNLLNNVKAQYVKMNL